MKTVAVSEFRAHLVDFLSTVESGETLVLTSRGKEIARIVPPKQAQKQARQKLAELQKYAYIGDVVTPAVAGDEWSEQ